MHQITAETTFTLPKAQPVESWVDATIVAKHLGCKPDHVRKMAVAGSIPGSKIGNGKRDYWRFKLSAIDEALSRQVSIQAQLN